MAIIIMGMVEAMVMEEDMVTADMEVMGNYYRIGRFLRLL